MLEFGISVLAFVISSVALVHSIVRSSRAEKIAKRAAESAEKSADGANRSAKAAERSADAEEGLLQLQRSDALATETEREARGMADVRPIRWEGHPKHRHHGVVIQNFGQGTATEIEVQRMMPTGTFHQSTTVVPLAAGDTSGVDAVGSWPQFTPDDERPEPPDSTHYVARVLWTDDRSNRQSSERKLIDKR